MALAVGLPTIAKYVSDGTLGSDFYFIARAIEMGPVEAYQTVPFGYPPTTLLFLWPMGAVGFAAFTVLSAAAFIWLCKDRLSRLEMALIPVAFPFVNAALNGQPTFLVASLTLLGLAVKDRRLAGVLFAVAAAIKPQLVVLVPLYLVARRDWRAFAWAGGSYAAFLTVSAALFWDAWQLWPSALRNYHDAVIGSEVIKWVITPIGVAERFGLPVWPVVLGCAIMAAALAFVDYADPIEALFGLTLAALLVLPLGCPDNALGLVPLLARRVARGGLLESLPFSNIVPWASIPASFAALTPKMKNQAILKWMSR